jgi:hypothetical protein
MHPWNNPHYIRHTRTQTLRVLRRFRVKSTLEPRDLSSWKITSCLTNWKALGRHWESSLNGPLSCTGWQAGWAACMNSPPSHIDLPPPHLSRAAIIEKRRHQITVIRAWQLFSMSESRWVSNYQLGVQEGIPRDAFVVDGWSSVLVIFAYDSFYLMSWWISE